MADLMGRKTSLRVASTSPPPANAAVAATSEAASHMAQAQPGLAAAGLLPALDAAGSGGDPVAQAAAELIRALIAERSAPDERPVPAEEHLADAVHRLSALLVEQDRHIGRLQALLEGLL